MIETLPPNHILLYLAYYMYLMLEITYTTQLPVRCCGNPVYS